MVYHSHSPGHARNLSDTTQKSLGSGYSGIHQAITVMERTVSANHIEPFVGVVGHPEMRKGRDADPANTIRFDQVYRDLPHIPLADVDNYISFAQAEQAAGRNPPPYLDTSDDTPPRLLDEFGHRRLRGEMGSGDTLDPNTSRNVSGGEGSGSKSQLCIARAGATGNIPDRDLARSGGNRTKVRRPQL